MRLNSQIRAREIYTHDAIAWSKPGICNCHGSFADTESRYGGQLQGTDITADHSEQPRVAELAKLHPCTSPTSFDHSACGRYAGDTSSCTYPFNADYVQQFHLFMSVSVSIYPYEAFPSRSIRIHHEHLPSPFVSLSGLHFDSNSTTFRSCRSRRGRF
jgi:hypothetical protein